MAEKLPGGKLLKILLEDCKDKLYNVKICTCDDEIIVNVTLTENIQPFAFLTILLISSFDERVIERVSSWTFEDECLAR